MSCTPSVLAIAGWRIVQIAVCSFGLLAVPLAAEVKLLLRDGIPIVDGVYVNGNGPYRFLLDTGTTVNLIEVNLARSIGLKTTLRTELATASGVVVVPGCEGIIITLDPVKADGQRFLFLGLETIQKRWPDVQGALGQAFLSQFDYTLDLKGKRLEFSNPDETGTRTRFSIINGRPAVTTSLGELILDSAAVQLVLFGIEPKIGAGQEREVQTFTGTKRISMVFSKPLIIEGWKVWRGDALTIPHSPEPGVSGLLPLRLFKAVYVCNSEGYVVFK